MVIDNLFCCVTALMNELNTPPCREKDTALFSNPPICGSRTEEKTTRPVGVSQLNAENARAFYYSDMLHIAIISNRVNFRRWI